MTGKEKALKISLLERTLREEYGIETRAQLVEACSKLPPLDITIFVAPVPPHSTEKPDS